jgi:hypothetical protein
MPATWKSGREFPAVTRLVGIVDPVLGVAERGHAVDDAVQRVLPLNAAAEARVWNRLLEAALNAVTFDRFSV